MFKVSYRFLKRSPLEEHRHWSCMPRAFSGLTWRTVSRADRMRCVMALLWCSRRELNSSLQVKEERSPILMKV